MTRSIKSQANFACFIGGALRCVLLLSSILLFSGCLVDQSAPLNNETRFSSLTQSHTVGDIRAIITAQLNRALGISVCFGKYSQVQAQVISGTEALLLLKDLEHIDDDPVMHSYMLELDSEPNAKVVRVEFASSGVDYDYIFVPDLDVATNGVLIDIATVADWGETCVSCVNSVGRVSPCACTEVVKVKCGKDPSISCLGVCSWCPSGGSIKDIPAGICQDMGPYFDNTLFASLNVGKLL